MDIISTRGPCTRLWWCTAGECAPLPVKHSFALSRIRIICLERGINQRFGTRCSSGVGRTGAFCLLYAALQELEAGNGIPDLPLLVKKMRQQRKNMLQEKVG